MRIAWSRRLRIRSSSSFRLAFLHLLSSTFILSHLPRFTLSFLSHLVFLHRFLSPFSFLSLFLSLPSLFSSPLFSFSFLFLPSLPSSSFSFLILPHPSSSLPLLPPDACFIFATTVTRALHNETFQETVPKQDELVLYDWRRMRDGACFAYRRRVRHERKELLWILGMPHGCWYPPALCF